MIIDTHTHIYLNTKITEEDILEHAKNSRVDKMIAIWVDLKTSQKCLDLSQKYENIFYPVVWIHPCDTFEFKDNIDLTINKLEIMILENITKIKAIWECWLDYFHLSNWSKKNEEISVQKEFFIKQIALSKKYDLPLVIHVRDAFEEAFEILKQENVSKFVLHCYTWDLNFAYRIIYYFPEAKISFSWIVTYSSAKELQNVASNIPLEKIFVETDCPYLAPQEVRWQENEPANVWYTLDKIVDLRIVNWKKETKEEIYAQIRKNSLEFFGIK